MAPMVISETTKARRLRRPTGPYQSDIKASRLEANHRRDRKFHMLERLPAFSAERHFSAQLRIITLGAALERATLTGVAVKRDPLGGHLAL